jgi:hypothetical protein
MSRCNRIGQMVANRFNVGPLWRTKAPRPELKKLRRSRLRVERLETRLTPSVNPLSPFELDGNVTTSTAHDWDQVFADAGSPAGSGSYTQGPASQAVAGRTLSTRIRRMASAAAAKK